MRIATLPAEWTKLRQRRALVFWHGVAVAAVFFCAMGFGFAHGADPFKADIRTTEPLSPEEERQTFHLPAGFEIQLFAAEPDIQKPLNMAFDAKGRLWVSGSTEYPFPAPSEKPGRDTIKILEDTDGDGRADKITTFADGLNIPIGLYPYRNGVIAFSIPYIYFLEDVDGDDRADQRHKLLGPFDCKHDTHGMNNAFRRGFDGWIYACHGWDNRDTITARDGSTISMNGGATYRFRPDAQRIELFTRGQVNPFGMTIDPRGDLFNADCHTKPIMLLLRGGCYENLGKPHDGLGFVPPVMQHNHGSTAIAGTTVYEADNFPLEYRGNMFAGNVMTSRVNRDSITFDGSTVVAHEEPDFVTSDDPWFRPVDLQVGPDGALYIADFYNRIIGHYEVPLDHPGRDRERGRIWRVTYVGSNRPAAKHTPRVDLSQATVEKLAEALQSPNLTLRLRATDELSDRCGIAASDILRSTSRDSTSATARAHSLWVLFRLGQLESAALVEAAKDSNALVRTHVMRMFAETSRWSPAMAQAVLAALRDRDGFVCRAAVDALGKHPELNTVNELLDLCSKAPLDDVHLYHMAKIALREQLRPEGRLPQLNLTDEKALSLVSEIALGIDAAEAGTFLTNSLARLPSGDRQLPAYVAHAARFVPVDHLESLISVARQKSATALDLQLDLFTAIDQGLQQRGLAMPAALSHWGTALVPQLLAETEIANAIGQPDAPGSGQPAAQTTKSAAQQLAKRRQSACKLSASLKLAEMADKLAEIMRDRSVDLETRAIAAQSYVALHPLPESAALTQHLTDGAISAPLRNRILQAVGSDTPTRVKEILAELMRAAPERLQKDLALKLTEKQDSAETLLAMLENGSGTPRLLRDETIREKLRLVSSGAMSQRIDAITADLLPQNAELQQLIVEKQRLFAASDHAIGHGERVFAKHCMACHQFRGRGATVGPQLEGIGNRGEERVIEDILDPNRNVDPAFHTAVYLLNDGRVLAGLFRRTEGRLTVIVDPAGKEISFPTADIEVEKKTKSSLMPNNFGTLLSDQDFNELVAVLLADRQARPAPIDWKAVEVDPRFRSEGVAVADINHDGKADIVVGELWYEAPNWRPHEIYPVGNYGDGTDSYSSCFACFAADVNRDGWSDAIVVDFPGKPCHWYENPQGKQAPWNKHLICSNACNETPLFVDLFGQGRKVLVLAWQADEKSDRGQMVWLTPGSDPSQPWEMNPISEASSKGNAAPGTQRYSHGLGTGDLNGDGRIDVLCTQGWWEQPAITDKPWPFHGANLGEPCANMCVLDINGDDLADVVSSSAHNYGIWGYTQEKTKEMDAVFKKRDLFPHLLSQTHALACQDLDGDGLADFVTGKRWWAHGPQGDPGSDEPAALYWFRSERDSAGGLSLTPYLIHSESGVGTQFDLADVNGDGKCDIVTSNKKGVHLFLQQSRQ